MWKDIIQTDLPRITPSSVGDLECSKKYWKLRVQKEWPKREPLEAVAHGNAVHKVLRQVYLRRANSEPDMRNLRALAEGAVGGERYPEGYDHSRAVKRVIDAVGGFVNSDDYEDVDGTIALERQVEFPFIRHGEPLYLVSATLDRILVRASRPTQLVVRDYKTTAQRINLQEAFIILWVAKRAYPDFESYALEYDWLDEENRVKRDTIPGTQLRGQHRIITEAAVRVLTATEHHAEPGACCTYCPLRVECQRLDPVEIEEGEEIF